MDNAQSSIEYIVIYGWALIILAIVVAILFYSLGIPKTVTPNTCTFSSSLLCSDIVIGANQVTGLTLMTFQIENEQLYPIANPMAVVNINGANTSAVPCSPSLVPAGGAAICSTQTALHSSLGQFVSGGIYVVAGYCGLVADYGVTHVCSNPPTQTYGGSFSGHAEVPQIISTTTTSTTTSTSTTSTSSTSTTSTTSTTTSTTSTTTTSTSSTTTVVGQVYITLQIHGTVQDSGNVIVNVNSQGYTPSQLPQTISVSNGSMVTFSPVFSVSENGKTYQYANYTSGCKTSYGGGNFTAASDCTLTFNYATVLAPQYGYGANIAIYNGSVYWANSSTGTVLSAPTSGAGPTITLASNQPNPLGVAISGGILYWSDKATQPGYGSIKSEPARGGPISNVINGITEPGSIAVDTSNVYWADVLNYTINSAPLSGTGPATELAYDGTGEPYGIVLYGSNVYWITHNFLVNPGGDVDSVPVGGGPITYLETGQNEPVGINITANNNYLYYANGGAGRIWRIPVAGGSGVLIAQVNPDIGIYLAADTNNVYWCGAQAADVEFAPVNGSGPDTILATNQTNCGGLTINNNSVYWMSDSKKVLEMTK